ncbi:MAG TPA: hypothetical protein VEX68_13615 [Bryobacteraceae bacterium]|nr:hypothetical protein [Bryobacteraceae bacterium]
MHKFLLTAVCVSLSLSAADPSAVEIVRRATERENSNLELRRQYMFKETANERRLDKAGNVEKNEQTVHEIFYIAGEQFRKLVAKNGQPLPEKEAAKEQKRLDKQIEKRKNENPSGSAKREAKELREAREFRNQVVDAYNFQLVGEESVGGRSCYRIHAEPKPGFRPKGEAKILTKIKGDLWIDKDSYKWARVEAETIDTITGLGGIVRIAKGSTINVRQTFVNGEVWFPDRLQVKAKAKALLFLSAAVDYEALYSDFKKFSVDSKVFVAEQ